ncbi:FAD assembly factor SdhE [Methylosarcina fibrata]|uniref:FAD assembly factor SdhE n=1 Tax=Methylosarcina fibrata TaxID=105972 RepID=UPI000369D25C|nr:succinate dehydrogenase assembly factor 2 [Methylosarcina fibrata]
MKPLERLRWQCRRGALELDLILEAYLDTHYRQADDDEKKRFNDLLEWEDDELLAVLLGDKPPDAAGFDVLIARLKRMRTGDSPA